MGLFKPFLIVIGVMLVPLCVVIFSINSIRNWMVPNQLIITTKGAVNKGEVDLKWLTEAEPDTIALIENGIDLQHKFQVKGENQFFVYYQGEMVGSFEHFKTESWHGHQYNVVLSPDSVANNLIMEVAIHGPDAHR